MTQFLKPVSSQSIDRLWMVGLTTAAALLLLANLGGLPLKDWDEGLVAQVAREIYQAPVNRLTWLFPTLWGEPYFNKPPLVHGLIALLYAIGGINEWTARLPSAGFTLASVPLLYSLGRELFPQRLPAIFATLVYLTSLPVIRNGRFAMLDGAILCFLLLLLWCLLRARRNYRWLLGAGWAFGLLCLTKGLLVGLLAFGVDLAAVLAEDLVVVLAGGLAAGLIDLAGAFNAGLALATGLVATFLAAGVLASADLTATLPVAFFATEFLMWPLTSAVAAGLGAPNFRRTGVPPQISSRL